ncbi:hypothetical protein JOF48_003577 [Arthrobacter stackebrandtii]|uniref:Uncharacterized protein n=1 Tax=Arthrobacter stackebrandtii TaxID=272161 RepID=A0ABS4Z3F6_9MICC|nr:hypothetical protein [Arthrobacter stackebrandtii]
MNMMGLAIVIAAIVVITVVMGLVATHGQYKKPSH